jgi:chromosome segregation ATPase
MDLTTIIVTAVTVIGSAGAWKFYEEKMKLKHQEKSTEKKDDNLYRDDLRERVAVMESKLEITSKEKEDLMHKVSDLKAQLTEYKIRLEYLEKENERLKYSK